ncbi:hypothetical protein B0J17DRAFT_709984 [Rhizoctonia solani]|nr:hypothetical protein B0J17DRAFT_709984 [Rhizoctonia solani]
MVLTECNVRYAVVQVRERMKVTRSAIRDFIVHTVDNLFPDELPIELRIPTAQNSRLRQLLWLARPESAFCLWRTSREIQNCDSVKHQELQRYLSSRINACSQDVRILGVGSQEVETTIREAMGRIWLIAAPGGRDGDLMINGISIDGMPMGADVPAPYVKHDLRPKS